MTDLSQTSFYAEIDQNLVGPQGAQGIPGAQGPIGPPGPLTPLPLHADNAAAITAGLTAGTLYSTTSGAVRMVV